MRKYNVFVSIPEGRSFRTLYKSAILPVSNGKLEFVCYFDHPQAGAFERSIRHSIAYSNLVIGVLSELSPNVLYEIGVALGCGKPLVILTDSIRRLPSMLRHRDAIRYDGKAKAWPNLPRQLQRRCEQLLHGDYVPLRIRTHTELLLRQAQERVDLRRGRASARHRDPVEAAIKSYGEGDYEKVIGTLAPIQSSGPTSAVFFYLSDAHFLHAERLPEGGAKHAHYDKMLEAAERGHSLFPTHRDLHKNLGLAHLKLRHLDLAEKVFREMLEAYPTYDVARYDLACVFAQRGELFASIVALSAVIDSDSAWRFLARVDPDFDPLWYKDLFQRLVYPMPALNAD